MEKTKSKIVITATVTCGKCGSYTQILPGARCRSLAGVVKELRADGWKNTRKLGWVCCLEK